MEGVYDHALLITSMTGLAGSNKAMGNTCILGGQMTSVKFALVSNIMVDPVKHRFLRAEPHLTKSGRNI